MKNILPITLRNLACAGALALSATGAFADYSANVSALNPQGYWKLNEAGGSFATGVITNRGTAGTGVNGSYYLSPLAQQQSVLGAGNDPAVNFNGLNQFAEIPQNAALNPSGPFTVEFWANITNDTAGAKSGPVSRYITVPGGPTGQFGYLFFANNGNTTWQFRVYNGTAATTVTDTSVVDLAQDTWYHVVGVYDGSQIHIYVNGLVTSSATGVIYAPNTNAPTRIGAGTPETGPSLFFPGLLDNVAIYPTALTADKVAAHYEAATTNAAGYNTQILADNPTIYYPMNEPALPSSPVAANSGALGSAYDGSYVFGVIPGTNGPQRSQFFGMTATNRAVDMNGTSGRIIIPALPLNADHVTYTAWVKRNGSQASFAGIMFTRPSATGLTFDGANRLSYTWNDAANTYNFNSGLTVPDGIWTFTALTVTPTNAILYMGSTNGLQTATNNVAHTGHDYSTAVLNLGWDNGARFLKGGLDEAALFDTALDYSVISNLFYSATPAVPLITRTADPLFEGMTITFTAYGVASGPVNYQWRKDGLNLNGQTSATLSLPNATTNTSGNYDVIVSFGANSVTSAVSAITVTAGPPVVFTNPTSTTRFIGSSVTFISSAGGSVPLTYQWQKNSNDIAGATSATLTLTGLSSGDAAFYRVKLINPYGTNFSSNAQLTVLNEAQPYPALAVSSGPTAYWRMNETTGTTAFDYAGGYNGTFAGPIVTGAEGPRPSSGQAGFEANNTAYTFNGTSTWTESPTLNFNTNTMTFAAWIKVAAYHPTDLAGILFSRGTAASGLHMIASGELRYHWEDGGHYGFASGLIVPQGQWVFVALVVEPNRATLYMNAGTGLLSAVNNATHNVIPGNDPIFIGRDRTDRVFNGDIDEAMIFKRALSPAEIQNLSLIGTSGPTAPQVVTLPTSQSLIAGQTAQFTVGAIGSVPITYQWKFNGTPIPGATGSTLVISNVDFAQAGSYSAGITNSLGGTNSPAAALTVSPTPQFANLTNALVLHLTFDGNVDDSSGRTNHGTIAGTTNYASGKLGQAYVYSTDTTNSLFNYVTLGTPADLQFGSSDFSVAYWVKFTGSPGDLPFLGSAANSYGNFGVTFAPSYNGGGWSYWLGGTTGANSIGLYGPGDSINNGAWHSLVHTFDRDGSADTFLDGQLVDSRSMTTVDIVDSGLPFNIGQDPTGVYQESATGNIDDLGIWLRALTPVEAQAIYLSAQNGTSFDTYGPVRIQSRTTANTFEIIWQAGTLQWADDVAGPYNPVPGATSPYYSVAPSLSKKFYRVKL